jgi:hypothetical protein
MMKTKSTSSRWLLTSATLAALAAGSATATETPAAPAAVQPQSSLDSGVRAYVDPATGKLRQATAAEHAEEARQSAAAAVAKQGKGKGVRFVKRADGTVRAEDLEGRLMESVVVQRNADGSLSYGYVGGDAGQVDPAKAPVNVQSEEK